ncbi:hypothetical protein MZE46_029595 [Pseudomonas sp. A4]|uniref:hypothetical protein n=1 Tax=Pseudomonas sp. S11A4 TaxID=1476791 RepID=UPI00215C4EFB|nr:hypothetical protein [Pseudomonas sp. S11A4]MCR8935729.1 hypothetical protein [Pseudomonas sp. S11A4]
MARWAPSPTWVNKSCLPGNVRSAPVAGPLGAIGLPQLPTGAAASSSVSIDNRAPISPATAAAYDSHDTYEINIHTTPGMDRRAIARAVRSGYARASSEKSARQRSNCPTWVTRHDACPGMFVSASPPPPTGTAAPNRMAPRQQQPRRRRAGPPVRRPW